MATFDPNVQDINPQPYIYWAQRPQPIKPNESTAELLKGGATAIKEGGRDIEAYNQRGYESDIYNQVDQIQQDRINRLQDVDSAINEEQPSVLGQNNNKLPRPVARLPETVSTLVSARENGHVSDSEYKMRLDRAAVAIRHDYPGYRPEIDRTFEIATERSPANRTINSLTADINAWAAAKKDASTNEDRQFFGAVMRGELPPAVYEGYKKGVYSPEVVEQRIYQLAKHKADLSMQDLEMRNAMTKRQLTEKQASDANSDIVLTDAHQALANFRLTMPGVSPMSIDQFMANRDKFSPAQLIQAQGELEAARVQWHAQALAAGTSAKFDKDGKITSPSRATMMGGPEEYEKLLKSGDEVFNNFAHIFGDKEDIPLAKVGAKVNEAIVQSGESEILKRFPVYSYLGAFAKIDPQKAYTEPFVSKILENGDLANDVQAWTAGTALKLHTQPDIGSTGAPWTLLDTINDGRSTGITDPKAYNTNISTASQTLAHPDAPAAIKKNVANGVFGPEDEPFMTAIKDSKIDDQGRVHGGKSTVLADLVNDPISRSVKKLADPNITQNYVNTSKKWFGDIFSAQIQYLNNHEHDPDLKFSYDTDSHSFKVEYTPPEGTNFERALKGVFTGDIPKLYETPEVKKKWAEDVVTKLNLGMKSMESISRNITKDDPDVFLLESMQENGLDLKGTLGNDNVSALVNALKAAHIKPTAVETGSGESKS